MKDMVGIIEGIRSGRKSNGQDARMLGEFLKMHGVETDIYKAYKTRKNSELNFLERFLDSDCRFLHVSAHGTRRGFSLQDKKETEITAKNIQDYCRNRGSRTKLYKPLHRKFVTISSCGHVSADFVMKLHENTGSTAVISASATVAISDSALFSSLFYFSLFECIRAAERLLDEERMKLSDRVALYVDAYQRAKSSYLGIGGSGAHRLDYWWNTKHVIVN